MDIFDKIMGLPGLKVFNPLYKKYKEQLLYLFFGGLAFLVSIISFAVLCTVMGMNELIGNVFSWIITVLFAFFTNRIWVFQAETHGAKSFWIQMATFFGGRVLTLVIEEAILFIFITRMSFNSMLIKVLAQIVVIVLNYVISKLLVFRKKK